MPNYLDDFLTSQQQPAEPSPTEAAPAPAPPEMQAAQAQAPDSNPIAAYMAKSAPKPMESLLPPGSAPETSIAESPLGILDRARLGWAKTPKAQQALLEGQFGKGNVQLLKKDGEAGFVVKQNGKWFDADPSFSWDTKGIKDMPGDVAQFVGSHGLKAAAAAKGAAMGAAAGLPAGPIGAAAGAVIGAGAGAAAEDAIETGGRYVLSKFDASNPASLPQNADEAAKQLMGSFMFGAEQELGGKILHGLGTGTVKALSGTLKRLGVTPEGKTLASKVLSVISGRPELETRLRVEDPQAMVPFDLQARQDVIQNKDTLYQKMKGMVQSAYDTFRGKQQAIGREYEPIVAVAKGLEYRPATAADELIQALDQNGYTKAGKAVNYQASGGIERGLSSEEQSLVNYLVTQANRIQKKLAPGDHITYQEMQNVIGTIDSKMSSFEHGISDRFLKKITTQFRADMKTHLSETLHAKDTAMAKAYADLNAKWGPVKELMEDLAGLSEDARVDGFVKKVLRQDGSYNADLASKLSELLGTADPTPNLLRAHVARNSTELWGGQHILGVPLGSPRAVADVATGASSAMRATSQFADAIPYLNETMSFLKGVGDKTRSQLMSHPEALTTLANITSSAHVAEKQTVEQLLQQAGVK